MASTPTLLSLSLKKKKKKKESGIERKQSKRQEGHQNILFTFQDQRVKGLVAELTSLHAQSAWGSSGEGVRAAGFTACYNYLSKKNFPGPEELLLLNTMVANVRIVLID